MKPIQLPTIRGRWLLAFRVLWFACLAATIVSMLVVPQRIVEGNRGRVAYERLGLLRQGDDFTVRPFVRSLSATISEGERIVAIDDVPVGPDGSFASPQLMEALEGPDGSLVSLKLKTANDEDHMVRLQRSASYAAQAWSGTGLTNSKLYIISSLLYAVANLLGLAVSILLFRGRPYDPVAALLSLSFLIANIIPVPASLGVLPIVNPLLYSLALALWYVGLIFFPSGRLDMRLGLLALIVALANVLLVTPQWYDRPGGLWDTLNYAAGTFALVAVAALMIQRYRSSESLIVRQQMRWVLFGAAVLAAGWILQRPFDFVANNVFPGQPLYIWSILGSILSDSVSQYGIPIGLLIALLRYRLYDAETLISRSAGYAALTLLLTAVFAGSEKMIELFSEDLLGHHAAALSNGLAAAVAAATILPAHKRIHIWAEEHLQKALMQLRRGLPAAVGDLREVVTLPSLLDTVLRRIQRGVRNSRGAIVLMGDTQIEPAAVLETDSETVARWCEEWTAPRGIQLECDKQDPLFPARLTLRVEGQKPIGWVLLGPRPDGSFFSRDERSALEEIAEPVARAIQVARQRALWQSDMEDRLARVEAELLGAPRARKRGDTSGRPVQTLDPSG